MMTQVRAIAAFAALMLCAAGCVTIERAFVPEAESWSRWDAHDPGSTLRIDHGAWNAWLERYVATDADGINRVAYGRIEPADKAALAAYLDRLGAVPVGRLGRDEQFAFWVNLYNAATVHAVLAHYPVASIRDIRLDDAGLAGGPWRAKLLRVEGVALALDDIEHRILRPLWREPRVHYALNCAALGCPNLQRHAFTAENTEALLEAGARAFVIHPRGVRRSEGGFRVSSLYAWFEADFGGLSGVQAHLRRYGAPDGIERIEGYDYDWTLNAAP